VTRLAELALESRDGLVMATVRGELDLSNVREISGGIVDGTPNSAAGLIVDLSAVTYLDSAGLNCLFDMSERLRTRRQRFCIVVPRSSLISRIISFSNMREVADVAQNVEDAVTAISRPGASGHSPT
jgi:anti-anti-sigma factor